MRLETKASQIINKIITPPKKETKAPKEEIIFQNNILSA
jgi:hypothetical protein